jgi:hypothetical protein
MTRSNGVFFPLASYILLLAGFAAPAWCAPPVLYSAAQYESPVRGDPDDLLLIAGSGLAGTDEVVYKAVSNTTQAPAQPTSVPGLNTALLGVADLVSTADAPNSLTVHLPAVMTPGQSYALWVYAGANQWSAPVLINDARPLWVTPDSAYQTAALASLPRVLKVVGRNLQPAPGATGTTQVRLVGQTTGTTYTLTAHNTNNDAATTTSLERYVAAAPLPASLVVDTYTVQVSRDATSWVALLGNGQTPAQVFTVNKDPVTPNYYPVGNGTDPVTGVACSALPNSGNDATGCILAAIRAAWMNGGGTVLFGPGVWTLSNPGSWAAGIAYSDRAGARPGGCPPYPPGLCGVTGFGVTVPIGVNLQGSGWNGANPTVIQRSSTWLAGTEPIAAFVLQGNNVVSGIEFQDTTNYATTGTPGTGMLQLGYTWYFARIFATTDPTMVSNVVITNNLFVQPYLALDGGGLPVDHLYFTENTIGGAYIDAIGLGQLTGEAANLSANASYPYQTYHFSDTVIDYNNFYPSSFVRTAANYDGGGSIATQINTGLRSDFSNNLADGTVTQYLYNPSTDAPGWRAAYFFSPGADMDMTLVSSNVATCTGDKYGDGEAIAYDGSTTQGGMPAAQPVIAAASWTDPATGVAGTALTVQGTVLTTLKDNNGNPFSIASNPSPYYQGFWVQLVQGTGKGQWRKLESLSFGSNSAGPTVTLNVSPAFDVAPDATSMVVIDHAYWQNVTVDNYIDQRSPACKGGNARKSGGIITWYGSTADSAMEGNQQYATSGVLLNHVYHSEVNPVGLALQSFNEVSNNLVDGTYAWSDPTSSLGGIQLGYGAYYCGNSSCAGAMPPDLGFGVSVSHNTIVQADGTDGGPPIGAIGMGANWSTGPVDSSGLNEWPLGDATLVFQNTLQNISKTVPGTLNPTVSRIGIGIDNSQGSSGSPPTSAINWRTVLYANTCSNVDIPVSDLGIGSVRFCPTGGSATCECSGIASADVGVTAVADSGPVSAGGSVTYTVTVTNNSGNISASKVALVIQPSAGVQITGASFVPSQGSCDASVNLCTLGSIPALGSATVSLSAVLPTSGSWPVTFSVTHGRADNVQYNNSAIVTETVQ